MEESTTCSNRSEIQGELSLERLEEILKEFEAQRAADPVVAWVVHPDRLAEMRAQLPPAAHSTLGLGVVVTASAFLAPGYAVGRDAHGNVVTIIGPEKTITGSPQERQFWGR